MKRVKRYTRSRKSSAKKRRSEYTGTFEDIRMDSSSTDSQGEEKTEKLHRTNSEISLWSLTEALMLIKTYRVSQSKQLVEESCQLATEKHVKGECWNNTSLSLEHNYFSFRKEIFLQCILRADFLTGLNVLISMLECENIALALHSTYFKKAALHVFLYSDDDLHLVNFLKYLHKQQKDKHTEEHLFKVAKTFMKLETSKGLRSLR